VIANESYEDFANQLQTEMVEAGVRFKREMVQNERDKVTVRLRKGYDTDPQFIALWERIRARTRYSVAYKTGELITKAAKPYQGKDASDRAAQGGADPCRDCHRHRRCGRQADRVSHADGGGQVRDAGFCRPGTGQDRAGKVHRGAHPAGVRALE
jgi:hypothetical protein